MAVQAYTITSAAPVQPASNSYTLAVDDPSVQISGLVGDAKIDIRKSMDGSDPTAIDSIGQFITENGGFTLVGKIGDRVVFRGINIDSDVRVEIRSS